MRNKTAALAAITTLSAAVSLSGCSTGDGPDFAGVCMNVATHVRLDDSRCPKDAASTSTGTAATPHAAVWVFYASGRTVPAVGKPLTGYSTAVTGGDSFTRGGVSAKGGTVDENDLKEGTTIHGGDGGQVVHDNVNGGNGVHEAPVEEHPVIVDVR